MVNVDHMFMLHKTRDHVGQQEDKMRKGLQQALAQEASVRHDQLQQALRQQVCQEEYAVQLRHLIAEQAMKQLESHSPQFVSQQ